MGERKTYDYLKSGSEIMNSKIYEKKELRQKNYVFKDRLEAGKILGEMLDAKYKEARDGIVLAIPAGGVPVGIQVSRKLKFALDLIIIKKIPIPHNPEAGYGAVTLEGSTFLNEDLVSRLKLNSAQIENDISLIRKELEERNNLFRDGRPFPDLSNKTAILVDDGLASGYTMMASIDTVRNKGAKEIVIAIPTSPMSSIERIESLADEIYCANIRDKIFFAVADAYEHWYDLSREEVLSLIKTDTDTKY